MPAVLNMALEKPQREEKKFVTWSLCNHVWPTDVAKMESNKNITARSTLSAAAGAIDDAILLHFNPKPASPLPSIISLACEWGCSLHPARLGIFDKQTGGRLPGQFWSMMPTCDIPVIQILPLMPCRSGPKPPQHGRGREKEIGGKERRKKKHGEEQTKIELTPCRLHRD